MAAVRSLVNLVRREPAVLLTVGDGVLMVLVAFGLPVTTPEKTAVDALLVIISGVIIRSQVTPNASAPTTTTPPKA